MSYSVKYCWRGYFPQTTNNMPLPRGSEEIDLPFQIQNSSFWWDFKSIHLETFTQRTDKFWELFGFFIQKSKQTHIFYQKLKM